MFHVRSKNVLDLHDIKLTVMKFVFPSVLTLAGIMLAIFAAQNNQNMWFLCGALAIVVTGVLALLNALDVLKKLVGVVLMGVCILISAGLAWANYKSINDPIEFIKKRDVRYLHVKQRLIEIRKAELAYKNVYGKYCADFDTLLAFVRDDSLPVVKAIGTVPDTLTEDSALLLGIITRDTVPVSVEDSIFSPYYQKERKKHVNGPFYLDSLPFVPFTGGVKFELDAGMIKSNGVQVAVFECKDAKPFDPQLVYKVGSMTNPSTSGNWAE